MHSYLQRSAKITIAFFIAGVFLVGCASSGSVPGAASGAPQPQLGHLVRPPTFAQPDLAIGNEMMSSSRGNYQCFPIHGWYNTFKVKGAAQGPYPGKFHASGTFTSAYNRLKSFSESFTITSRKNTITGSFVWNGGNIFAFCDYLAQSTNFTYTATLMRGSKVIKQFAGSASENGIHKQNGHKMFGETLI
jgi:hypothetical protein